MKEYWPLALAASSAFAVLASFWSKLQGWFSRLRSHAIVTSRIEMELGGLLINHLSRVGKRSKYGEKHFGQGMHHVRSLGRMRRIALRVYGRLEQIYWVNGWPVWVGMIGDAKNDRAATGSTNTSFPISFTFIRGTFDVEASLLNALDEEASWLDSLEEGKRNRYEVVHIYGAGHRKDGAPEAAESPGKLASAQSERFQPLEPLCYKWDDLGPAQSKMALECLALVPELKRIVDIIRMWYRDRAWYKERGIPWRRGFLFHGPPGGGKTSLARGVAEELDLPIYRFDLASMTNSEFQQGWRRVMSNMPCMVLFEDWDGVFEGRENVSNPHNGGGLTIDCVLNCLDGIERPEGLLLIITTNKVEHIDDAIGRPIVGEDGQVRSSRPGRIDKVVEFKPLDMDGRHKVAMRIVRDETKAAVLVKEGLADSAAQFTERCCQVAMDERMKEYDEGVADVGAIPQIGPRIREVDRGKDGLPGMPSAKFQHYRRS